MLELLTALTVVMFTCQDVKIAVGSDIGSDVQVYAIINTTEVKLHSADNEPPYIWEATELNLTGYNALTGIRVHGEHYSFVPVSVNCGNHKVLLPVILR